MERFIEPPNQGKGTWYPECKFCGERHRRDTLDDACAAEWAGAQKSANLNVDSTSQPAPKSSTGPALWDLVVADMQGRDHFGKHKYGIRLQPHNGRDFLVDAYQEALDLAVYLRGLMYERDAK